MFPGPALQSDAV